MLDVIQDRAQYPALKRTLNGLPIIYLDNAATGLKPIRVIDAVTNCFLNGYGNVGRGVHRLAEEAQQAYDRARLIVADFINADPDEIIFTSGATSALNLVANSLPAGSRVLTTLGEHHSNLLASQARHECVLLPTKPDGLLEVDAWRERLAKLPVNLAAFHWVSNVSGAIQPVYDLVSSARQTHSMSLVDASQAVGHMPVDVHALGCDFLCFSGHKLGAPAGIGVLYARREAAERLKPVHFGGGMVDTVEAHRFSLASMPNRLEAGTPALEAAVGLAAACEYLSELGLDAIERHEQQLVSIAMEQLSKIDRLEIVGPTMGQPRAAIVSWMAIGLEAHGLARLLSSRYNIMVRSGFHCAQPLHMHMGWRPTVRASFAHFNTIDEIVQLKEALETILAAR